MEDILWRWLLINNPLKSEHTMQTHSGELIPPKLWFEKYYQDNENVCSQDQRKKFLEKFCNETWTRLIEKKY